MQTFPNINNLENIDNLENLNNLGDIENLDKATFAPNLEEQNIDIDFLIENTCLIFHINSEQLYFSTNRTDHFALAEQLEFLTGLKALYFKIDSNHINQEIERLSQNRNLSLLKEKDEEATELDLSADSVSDAPIVKYINTILNMAVSSFASDIHFEPYEQNFRIRFRLDGILQEKKNLPIKASEKILSRLKIMAKLDISEKRLPQDGAIKLNIGGEDWDIRVNTLPTIYGEKIVLRILDKRQSQIGIDDLGLLKEQKQIYLNSLSKPQGMILITGPTGSGKTVSLYTGLGLLNTSERNISTAEDPVEIKLDGINQVNIQPKIGLDFSECLRAFLRQDPDIIMVGEIRDLETAEIAVKAAQTGHLVLSTLHTNSAVDTIARLVNLGIEKYNLADSLQMIGAQRLVRKLCDFCKEEEKLSQLELERRGFFALEKAFKNSENFLEKTSAKTLKSKTLKNLRIYKAGAGCDKCNQGYKGRVGIFEILEVDEKLRELLLANTNLSTIKTHAKSLIKLDLEKSGLHKVAQGITSLKELERSLLLKGTQEKPNGA